MDNHDAVKSEIFEFITNVSGCDAQEISENDRIEHYEIDSIMFIKLIIQLEHKFKISFEEDNFVLEQFDSIQQIIDYVLELIESK